MLHLVIDVRLPTTKQAFIAALFVAGIFPGSPLSPAGTPRAVTFAPDLVEAGDLALRGQTWTLEGPTYAINLRHVDDTERLNFIQRRSGLRVDPFAGPPGKPPRYVSFLVLIENRGQGDVQFNPIHSWMMTNRKQIESPLTLSDLSFAYHVVGRDFPPTYERVGPAMLQHPHAIKPGESLAGLLVYPVMEPGTKRFHVDVELTLPSGDAVTFSAPYRRVKTKQRER